MDKKLDDLNKLYTKYNCKLPGIIVVLGPLKSVHKSIIIIDRTQYNIEGKNSPVIAVNRFFKILIALQKQFPQAAKGPWQYIHKYIFTLNTFTKVYSQVRLLNTKVNSHKRILESKNSSKESNKRKPKSRKNLQINKKSKKNNSQVPE